MRFREWMANEAMRGEEAGGDGDGAPADLDDARHAGERLLRAGRAAIERTLSGESERYLREVRQRGGQ